MSKSNRLLNYALGLAAGLLVALAVGYPLWDKATGLDEAIIAQSNNAAQDANYRYLAFREVCSTIGSLEAQSACEEQEAKSYRQAQRDQRDLEAQQVMAHWTRVMGKAAIIGTGVGLFGLFLIFTTFWETRKAASAGFAANTIARNTADSQLRPYLGIDTIKPHHVGDICDEIIIFLKNFGSTPAENIRQEFGFAFVPIGTDSWPVFSGEVEMGREIAPGHTQKAVLSLEGWRDEVKQVARKQGSFRIILRVTYTGLDKPRPPLFAKIIVSRKGAHVAVESLAGDFIDGTET